MAPSLGVPGESRGGPRGGVVPPNRGELGEPGVGGADPDGDAGLFSSGCT